MNVMKMFLQQIYCIVIGMMISMIYILALISRWIIAGLFIGIHIRYGYPTIFNSLPMFMGIVIVAYDIFIKVPQLVLMFMFEAMGDVCEYQRRSTITDVKVMSYVVYIISALLLGIILFK